MSCHVPVLLIEEEIRLVTRSVGHIQHLITIQYDAIVNSDTLQFTKIRHILFSVRSTIISLLVSVSNGGRSIPIRFLNCPRASATKTL
jgi:hypothetical protein